MKFWFGDVIFSTSEQNRCNKYPCSDGVVLSFKTLKIFPQNCHMKVKTYSN